MANYNLPMEAACAWDGAPLFDFGGLILGDVCACSCPDPATVVTCEDDSACNTR